jgi:beta-mannanase
MIWSVPLLPNPASGGGPYTFAEGATGAYNSYFTTLATNLAASGWNANNCVIRLGWEFNGDWSPWFAPAGQEANFIAYWQNIVTAMRAVIPGLKFIWDPNVGNSRGSSALENYYPGSSYVNYIGMDIYDTASSGGPVAWSSYLTEDGYGLNWLANFSRTMGKPACIPEFGLGPDTGAAGSGDDPYFIAQIAAWITANSPQGFAAVWDPTPDSTWPYAVPSGTSDPNSDAEFWTLYSHS